MLIECRFTCIHLRIAASEGIRNPEIGRIPDTATQSIIIIQSWLHNWFVLRGQEQSRITANGNPGYRLHHGTGPRRSGHPQHPSSRTHVEGGRKCHHQRNAAVKNFSIYIGRISLINITVAAILSLIHTGIYSTLTLYSHLN